MKKGERNYHIFIDSYMDDIRNEKILSSKELKLAMDLIEYKLNLNDVFIDNEKIDKAKVLIEKYFEFKLLDWELFILALIHCYYKKADMVVFDEIMLMIGRGNGKNGFISPIVWYLTTHYHGIQKYNVDIIANAQDQAKTSFEDIYEVLENTWEKSKKFFSKTKEVIKNLRTKSYIKYNTTNAKTKDGKRSACLIFDEIHEYENYDMIKVFSRGFGKKKHSRIFYITTNGYVRDGVLDDKLRLADDVLNGTIKDLGFLPLIYKIDKKEEAYDPVSWIKANPSLPYFPELKKEMEKDIIKMKYETHIEQDFLTKRMNWPEMDREIQVTEWKNILATNREMPDLTGRSAVVGIDFASISDFASVGLLIRVGDIRYWITHSWLCSNSKDLHRLKIPYRDWARAGLLTIVDDVQIDPSLIVEWIAKKASKYNLAKVALDNFRYPLVAKELKTIGFNWKEYKNMKLVRPSDIMMVSPIIESCFAKQQIIWGDDPLMRWYTNNTKMIRTGINKETGNMTYGKIEPKSRKTDGFMALVAAMTIESEIAESGTFQSYGVQTY